MQAYRAYFECDRFIPLVDVKIREGSQVIVTVLDESQDESCFRQRTPAARFREVMCPSS